MALIKESKRKNEKTERRKEGKTGEREGGRTDRRNDGRGGREKGRTDGRKEGRQAKQSHTLRSACVAVSCKQMPQLMEDLLFNIKYTKQYFIGLFFF